jgi:CDP-diacylglycerol--glycerol-3-phosphate 3-phosphatidyltransferase
MIFNSVFITLDDAFFKESDRIKMFEYQRPGWTFHAKGVWHYLAGKTLPSATLVGSPNFGFRSVEKDLEAQITIVTENSELQRQMHLEQERLFIQSTPVTRETFDLPDRKIPTWVKWVVATARKFF